MDWKHYNNAQLKELELFESLLKKLVSNIPEDKPRVGRPAYSLRDVTYCAIMKIYNQRSSRRSYGIYKEAEAKSQIGKTPYANAINKFLQNPRTTPSLQKLIAITAQPFKTETTFAIDSTGFVTSRWGRYIEARYFGTSRKHKWVKCHAIVAVKSHAVVAVEVTKEHESDMNYFPVLFERIHKQGFIIEEALADKGYSSRRNMEIINAYGGTPYIDFKVNTSGKSRGCMVWNKMFDLHSRFPKVFKEHYNMRSNAEATFFAIKSKLGEFLRGKIFVSQTNELLCKIIAYNLTVLIREIETKKENFYGA